MCVVSNMGDEWRRTAPGRFPEFPWPMQPNQWPQPATPKGPSQYEFDRLKKEVESLKKLLEAAKRYDEETDQPDCHADEKVDLIRKVAKYVGVDIADVFGNMK